MEMQWKDLSEDQKLACYQSYVGDIIYEFGDKAKPMSYEEWCIESEKHGWALT